MDEKTAWDVYFAGIAAFRMHPRNDHENLTEQMELAAQVADLMLEERKKRWAG